MANKYEPQQSHVDRFAQFHGCDDATAAAEMDLEEEVLQRHDSAVLVWPSVWRCDCGHTTEGDRKIMEAHVADAVAAAARNCDDEQARLEARAVAREAHLIRLQRPERWVCKCGDTVDGDAISLGDHRAEKKGYTVTYPDGKRLTTKTRWLWKK